MKFRHIRAPLSGTKSPACRDGHPAGGNPKPGRPLLLHPAVQRDILHMMARVVRTFTISQAEELINTFAVRPDRRAAGTKAKRKARMTTRRYLEAWGIIDAQTGVFDLRDTRLLPDAAVAPAWTTLISIKVTGWTWPSALGVAKAATGEPKWLWRSFSSRGLEEFALTRTQDAATARKIFSELSRNPKRRFLTSHAHLRVLAADRNLLA